jgi:SAM-dependent methyltransferase
VRIHQTRYLDDGRGFNRGQPTTAIEIEDPQDYDAIVRELEERSYYDGQYLAEHGGQTDDRLTGHFWWLAEAVARLSPTLVLEVGCGRGDVLRLLREVHGVDVTGIDIGAGLDEVVWPSVRSSFRSGDIRHVLGEWQGPAFDVVCGFDIWEHLHPAELEPTLQLVVDRAAPDAWFFFVVPAFGEDPVFGERFPLELEENREAFERRDPFRFLITDWGTTVPAAGHLTWAHTDWWLALFDRAGLERVPDAERPLHAMLDGLVPSSVSAFYLLRRRGAAAPRPLHRWQPLRSLVRRWRYARRSGATFTTSLDDDLDRLEHTGQAHPWLLAALRRAAGRRSA